MGIEIVLIQKPEELNVILGQAHFIKTIEDIFEALATASSNLRFGIAFCEASGKALVRYAGNDTELQRLAVDNAQAIGAGHSFIVFLKNGFPISVLNQIKNIPEVCRVFCATANPLSVIVYQGEQGRGILGVIDGCAPRGVEAPEDIQWRKDFLRKIGYKL